LDSILPFFLLDLVVVATVIIVMARRMSFWHPLSPYLLFHFYSFTYRTIKILGGSPLMYAGQANAEAITPQEITRALLWADIGLLVFAAASWWAHQTFEARSHEPVERRILNPNIAKLIGVLCLPIGAYVFFALKASTLAVTEDSAAGGYIQVMSMWPIGVAGLLIFTYGFRWHLVLLAALFLSFVAFQGYHRFMLILPLLYLTAVYLQSQRRRWPTMFIVVGAIFVGLIFPRLKYIGRALQNGDTGEAISQFSQAFVKDTSSYVDTEVSEDFLDQFAGGLSLTDSNERKFWGSTYLAIVTLPIPRAWWPNKPGLADHLQEISTSGRRYDIEGRIVTYLGESYLNFGYAGLLLIPALMGYVLTAFCLHATSGPMLRLSRYVYLVSFMAMVQMFRDGLLSIFVFSVVHNMPMLFTLILHSIPGMAEKALDRPPADPLALEEEGEAPAQ
jgi:oligosaccharide repeat unit polymerase